MGVGSLFGLKLGVFPDIKKLLVKYAKLDKFSQLPAPSRMRWSRNQNGRLNREDGTQTYVGKR